MKGTLSNAPIWYNGPLPTDRAAGLDSIANALGSCTYVVIFVRCWCLTMIIRSSIMEEINYFENSVFIDNKIINKKMNLYFRIIFGYRFNGFAKFT